MTATHQYVVDLISGTPGDQTERLNQIASHGWRVISCSTNQFGHLIAVFEKPVTDE